jgi:hypothetical protein
LYTVFLKIRGLLVVWEYLNLAIPCLCLAVAKPAVAEKLQWTCAELPTEGQMVALVVSVMENPGEFYCYKYNQEGTGILNISQ